MLNVADLSKIWWESALRQTALRLNMITFPLGRRWPKVRLPGLGVQPGEVHQVGPVALFPTSKLLRRNPHVPLKDS